MATSEDVEEDRKENILYDLTVHAEWKQENEIFRKTVGHAGRETNVSTLGRLTSSSQRAGWTLLRTMGLPMQTASPCYLPPSLVKLVNCTHNWHIAVGSDGRHVAVLQDQCIEVRTNRDDYATVIGRVAVQRDPYPQWRRLSWSPDGTMLACSYSSGLVEVYDIVGTKLFAIPGRDVQPSHSAPTDLSGAVAALIFTDKQPAEDWKSELLVVNYHGNLSSYRVDRDKGFEIQHHFLFNFRYPLGVSSVEYHPGAGLIYVGGCGLGTDVGSESMREGLSVWRTLSDYPHYKLVASYDEDVNETRAQKSLMSRLRLPTMSYFKREVPDGIYKMSLSPSGTHLAAVHQSGKFSMWRVPSLKLVKIWEHSEQPFSDELSPELTENPQLSKQLKDLVNSRNLIDVNWWSDEAVILARCTGAVTVSCAKSLRNLLGAHPEWFEPAPQVTPVYDGGFLGLEVECRFASKRRLVAADDNEDSDDDESGLVGLSKEYTKHVLHFVTDMDRFKPPRKKPKLVNRTYRLVCLKSTTPEELFARKIDSEEYGEAKALAQAYGLDCDLVYQRQWHKSPVEISSIQDYLSKISKRSWVLHECQERMSGKIDAMKELLEFGLRGTDLPALMMIGRGEDNGRFILYDPEEGMYEGMEVDDFDPDAVQKREEWKRNKQMEMMKEVDFNNLTLEQRELCRARRKLLQYLYRLKTYECILGGVNFAAERFDPKFFEKFRSQNIIEVAKSYSQNSDWKALETLWTYHGRDLVPHRLAILSNFPETTSPGEYKSLLPELSDGAALEWETDSWGPPDWVDMEPCRSAIEPHPPDLAAFLYEDQPELQVFRCDMSADSLSDWYSFRACEIERLSRQTDDAVELVKFGMERGVKGLESILDDLVTMEILVYDCHIDDNLTFQRLQEMADYDKLELIMSRSSEEMYTKNLRKWMVPFLKQCERKSKGSYNHLLRDYVITSARSDLIKPLKLFEASKTHLPNPVILTQAELMSTAIEAIYSCERDDQLDHGFEILKCLPERGYGVDTKEVRQLHGQVDKLERCLGVARILEENGVKKPVYYIRDTENSADDAQRLMIKLTRMAGRANKPPSEAQWAKLHGDMMQLQDKVYRCIAPGLCHEIFVESLLCSSNLNSIQLAGRLVERTIEESRTPTPLVYTMQTRVPYERAIELVLASAQEYFNSSANLKDYCLSLARSCLALIQDTPPCVQEESDLIASLSLLEDFGVTLLPLQVRLCKDRLELVRRAVDGKSTAYKNKQKLLRLGHLLRVSGTARTEGDGRVLHLVARAALKVNDYPMAWEVCEELMSSGHWPAWDVCVDLAEQEQFQNVTAKVDLLSFAVTFCTRDKIEPILQARAVLETQVICERISSDPDAADDQSSRHSPFSTTAALQQTQQILTSTKQTTKAVFSTVTDRKWWQGTVNRLKQPSKRQVSRDVNDGNKTLEQQSCHPFYEGIIEHAYCNTDEADFHEMAMSVDPIVQTSESLLRTAQLEAILTEGEKSQPATEVLLQLAGESFATDNSLSLAYLLALQQPTDADQCFDDHPHTDISLQLAIYYYALQIYSSMQPCTDPQLYSLYTHNPSVVMQKVTSLVTQRPDFDWPEDVVALVMKIKHYNKKLQDYRQAKVLKKLGRGIDVDRFTEDAEYKQETILGLAMTLEENIYNIALTLAERYDIPLWQVYAAHIEFLFSDSGLSIEDIEAKVTKLDLLPTLRSHPDEFCERMTAYVHPTLDGQDHGSLLYYYTTLLGTGRALEGALSADGHVKLLKKIKPVAPGLDYKALTAGNTDVIGAIAPALTANNVTAMAKLAKLIPAGEHGNLESSAVYCAWAIKFFWDGDGKKMPETMAAWIHRYEMCGECIQKLQAADVLQLVRALLFTQDSIKLLGVECRQEICRRILKFCKQQHSRKKRATDSHPDSVTWETVATKVSGYLVHLETLIHQVVMAMAESEVTRVQEYYDVYDLSMGVSEKVNQLLCEIVLDGNQPLEMLDELLSVVAMDTCTVATIVKEALTLLLLKLREDSGSPAFLSETEPLAALQCVVHSVQDHLESGGDLVTSEDVLSQLRPFCSDASVTVQPRLDVLYILEKSFRLSEDDSLLLTLYRTQAIVTAAWTHSEVSSTDVDSAESREQLFQHLLVKSSTGNGDNSRHEQFSALCRLLKLWPPFPGLGHGTQEKLWLSVFKAMIATGCHDNVVGVIATIKETDTISLSLETTKSLFSAVIDQTFLVEAVKFALIVGHDELFPIAMETLTDVPLISEDEELIDTILKHSLIVKLVHTQHYPIIIQYLLANQNPDSTSPDHRSVEKVANQLKESGFEAEAGSLMLQARSTHPLLQTFGSALGVLGKWFK